MSELYATAIFLFAMFALLGGSIWVGLALVGVAYMGWSCSPRARPVTR